jgi:hypothetical protein
MNYKALFILLIGLIPVFAGDNLKVIYGEDDRFEPYEIESAELREASKSVAAIISNYTFVNYLDSFQLAALDFGEVINLCPGVPFKGQPKAARCSAFLVSADTVVTAGHCLRTQWDCKSSSFVFDYRMDMLGERSGRLNRYKVKKSKVYGCKEIVARKLNKVTKEDWAIVKLKRPVTDRRFLKVRKYGDLQNSDKLSLMGFPSGLPLKIATNGKLRENKNENYFVAELDAFHVNSGSPVINERTLEVEGILVRGEKDFETVTGCENLKICESGRCRGEDVTKILSVPLSKYLNKL